MQKKKPNQKKPTFYSYTTINSKYITGLNIKPIFIKLLEETLLGGNLHDFGLGNDFLDVTPKNNS